jgi:hypothetical protein
LSVLQEIVEVLATKVRLLTDEQVGEAWFGERARPRASARRALKRLESKGLVKTAWAMAHPRISLDGPLYSYRGSETPEPDFGRLAWKAAHRFKEPVVRAFVAKATKNTMRAFGRESCHRSERTSEITHDIHVSELFLKFRNEGSAGLWQGEDELTGMVRPDAAVGTVALDFIGSYSKAKLIALYGSYLSNGIQDFDWW